FTIKTEAVFTTTEITSIITAALGLLFGTGLTYNCYDRYRKWKQAKQKADNDPSQVPAAQNTVDNTSVALQNTKATAEDKSNIAKNNVDDLNQGRLLDKIKEEYDIDLVDGLVSLNNDNISSLHDLIEALKYNRGILDDKI